MSTHRFGRTDMVPSICVMGVGDAGATIVNLLAQSETTARRLVAVCTDRTFVPLHDLLYYCTLVLRSRRGNQQPEIRCWVNKRP